MENDLTLQPNGAIDTPPTEVVPRARRRRFSATYTLRILQEADAWKDVGSLLRREGLYSSQLFQWRKQRSEDVLVGGQPDFETRDEEVLGDARHQGVGTARLRRRR